MEQPIIPTALETRAVQQAAAIGTATASAANAINEAGNMGLKGMFGLVGQSTAMVCLTVMMFAVYYVNTSSTRSQVTFLEQLVLANVARGDKFIEDSEKNRVAYTEQHNNLFSAIHQLEAKVEALAQELRKTAVPNGGKP